MSIYRETPMAPAANADFVSLRNYNYSFLTRVKTSQLREAIAPGTMKHFSDAISADNVRSYLAMNKDVKTGLNHPENAQAFDNDGFVKINVYEPPVRRSDVSLWNSAPIQEETSYTKVYK